jgi:hypothetical protein
MKLLGLVFSFMLVGSIANAASINSGQYNSETQKVELSVSYGGGCSEHYFELQLVSGCRESFPVQCDLELVHTTDEPDMCEAYITQDLELDLPEVMLTDSYFERAFITIKGAGDTSVSFQLPQ